jgi:tetratricopeptide (TPR) repeat protein
VELRKAEALDGSQPDPPYTMGVTLWQMGDLEGAAKELRAAIRAKPDYAEAYYTLGTVQKQQGNLQDAAKSLREAIRLQPEFAGAHTTLAGVLRQLGDADGAASETRAGADLVKKQTDLQAAVFATNSGRRLRGTGDLGNAIAQFRAAIAATPSYAPAHYQLGLALRQQGNKEEAQQEFQKAAALDPTLTPPTE